MFDKDETDEERRARGVKGTKAADFTEFESITVAEERRRKRQGKGLGVGVVSQEFIKNISIE